jgi:hypothetical protein
MGQSGNPVSVEALETFLRDRIKTDTVPGLSVVKGDSVVWERGFADLATSTRTGSSTPRSPITSPDSLSFRNHSRRARQLLQPRLPGFGRGDLRGSRHELRGVRAR